MLKLQIRDPTPEDFVKASAKPSSAIEVKEVIKTEDLSPSDLSKLLKRAPPIEDKKDDEKTFFKREKSLKPPVKGEMLKQAFPPPVSIKKPDSLMKEEEEMKKELKILRTMPQGENLNIVPMVSVTFNQPMVPITSVEELKKIPVPVTMTPKVEGEWRWIGTKTVQWKPTHRLPKSTSFEVTIKKGVKSQLGCELKEKHSFKFSTIPLRVKKHYPSSSYERKLSGDGICHMEFNQKINKMEILQYLTFHRSKITLLTPEEVLKKIDAGGIMEKKRKYLYNGYKNVLKNAIPEQSIYFTCNPNFPLGTSNGVELKKGAKGIEGPRGTEKSQITYFYTYGKMKISYFYPKERIVPMQSWSITMTNNIEQEGYSDDFVKITPPLVNLKIRRSSRTLTIMGKSKGRTKYTVEISPKLKDVYGQPFEGGPVIYNVGSASQSLQGFQNNKMVVVDPTLIEEPEFSFITVNLKEVRVCVFQAHPKDYHTCWMGNDYYHHRESFGRYVDYTPEQSVNCGKKVFDKVVKINNYVIDEIIETKIQLRKHLQNPRLGTGQLIVYVEPTKKDWNFGEFQYRPRVKTWLQFTKIALDCHWVGGGEMYMFASSLVDGSSIPGVKFSVSKPLRRKGSKSEYEKMTLSTLGFKDGLGLITKYSTPNVYTTVYAEKDKDICFVPSVNCYNAQQDRILSYVKNDRNLYKPKEIVTIKGILRWLRVKDNKKWLEIPKTFSIDWEAFDSRGSKFLKGKIDTSKNGSFFFNFTLPDNVNLGGAYVSFKSKVYNGTHYFKIQEFRTPEFTSSCSVNQATRIADGVSILTGKAEYYSGGGLSGCDVDWVVNQSNTTYIPKGWSFKGFSFRASFYPYDKDGNYRSFPSGTSMYLREKFTDSNGENKACVEFHPNETAIIKTPVTISAHCNIKDINRQTMSSSTSFIVHPSSLYVGLKLRKYYARKGDIVPLDVVVTDIEGKMEKGVEVVVEVIQRKSYQKGYEWKTKDVVLETVKLVSDTKAKELNIKMKEGGSYYIFGHIKDKEGRQNNASTSLWVSGGKSRSNTGGRITAESVRLMANKKKYKVNDIAKILVSSPFTPPAEGLLCVYGLGGFSHQERFTLKDKTEMSKVLSVKITKEMIPNALVKVFLTGTSERLDETGRENKTAPKRPAYATGSVSLEIPPDDQKIEIEVIPEKSIMKPGEKGQVHVKLKGENVKKSLVSLIIVDEAVLGLTGYELPHPISSFYQRNYSNTGDKYLRSFVYVKNWNSIRIQAPPSSESEYSDEEDCGSCLKCCCEKCCKMDCKKKCKKRKCKREKRERKEKECDEPAPEPEAEPSGGEEGGGEEIKVRSNFCPLACFFNDQIAEDGTTTFKFTLPDNLTQYRIWALATNGPDNFGLGESSLQAQLPVAVRPSIPRFLNFGDKAYFTVVVQNQTLETITVDVGVRMTNLKLIDVNKGGLRTIIPFTKRAELRFYVETKSCGTGRFQVIASTGSFSDAVVKEVPIFTPATSEAFATYGEVDNDGTVIQSILPPPDIYNDFGGLSITTSSTALQSLTDAFLYLYNYKFDCVEQISSRMMSIFALQDILEAFSVPKFPTKEELLKVVVAGEKKIRSAQRSDGSIGFWSLRSNVNIYLSIHIAHTLIRGLEQGYKIDLTLISRGKNFCKDVNKWINHYTGWYSPYTKASLRAMALYVLTLYSINKQLSVTEKGNVEKEAKSLFKDFEKFLSMEGKAWLIFSLFYCSKEKLDHPIVKKVMSELKNNVNETPETANFITSYGDDGKLVMLHSDRRTDAILLEVFIHLDKKNYLIPKIVKGLLKHRKKGRWNSTQENVYILLALKKYFKTFENVVPDFLCRVWLGEEYCGDVKFKGRETDFKIIDVPMKHIVPDDTLEKYEKKNLAILKEGQGRLYYRLAMDYAPKSLKLKPVDYGFIVERTYEGVAKKEHCVFDKDKGMWIFKAGELIRTKLKLTNNSRRYHVALVDFLPAGCEVLNPELKGVSPEAKKEMNANSRNKSRGSKTGGRFHWSYYWYRPWYEHTNLRDERVEVFSSYLYCGIHEFSYLMRATSYGTFVIPPTKAEEMYSPELFGRSGSEKVIIQ